MLDGVFDYRLNGERRKLEIPDPKLVDHGKVIITARLFKIDILPDVLKLIIKIYRLVGGYGVDVRP